MMRNIGIYDFGSLELSPIRANPQLPPEFSLVVPRPQLVFPLREVPMNGREFFPEQGARRRLGLLLRPTPIPIATACDGDDIQPRPLCLPLLDVAATKPR